MRRLRSLVITLLATLLPAAVSAQTARDGSQREFRALETVSGNPGKKIYQVQEDASGFLWFYSNTGLLRFDGYQIRRYDVAPSIQSRDQIQSATKLLLDPSGALVVGLRSGAILRYDVSSDSFILLADVSELFPGNLLYSLAYDGRGRLLFGTGSGAWLLDENGPSAIFEGGRVGALLPRPDGSVLLGSTDGLWLGGGRRPEKIADSSSEVTSIIQVAGKPVFGTFTGEVLDASGHGLRGTGAPVRTLLESGGHILAATDGEGLYELESDGLGIIRHYLADPDRDGSICGSTLSDISIDSRGTLWAVSSTDGICYSTPSPEGALRYRHLKGEASSLISDHVNVVMEDSKGNLWFGTNDGLSRLGAADGSWKHFLRGAGVILALAEGPDGHVWVGGYGMPLSRISPDGTVRTWSRKSLSYVYSILREGNSMLIGGLDGPLLRYGCDDDSLEELDARDIGDMTHDPDGNLLLATTTGLSVLGPGKALTGSHNTFGGSTLRYAVRAVASGKDGIVWLATDGDGLIGFSPADSSSVSFTTDNGLFYNSVSDVVCDSSGLPWLTTEDRLYCIIDGTLVGANDFLGFDCGYFSPNSGRMLSDGTLIFGTASGAVRFAPDFAGQDNEDALSAIPFLTDFILTGSDSVMVLAPIVASGKTVRLSYRDNSFAIGYSTTSFEGRFRLRFDYILEGASEDWVSTTDADLARFTGIRPGKYTFRVRSVNRFTGEVLGETALPIRVRLPWWFSGWAWTLYVLIAALGIFQYLALQRRREEELASRERLGSFISFAHDLKTPLTLIKLPLSEIQEGGELSGADMENITLARRNTDRLMEMVNGLLDLREDAKARPVLEISPCDIASLIEDHIDEVWPLAREKGLTLSADVNPSLGSLPADVPTLSMILGNLLSNAVKYTDSGSVTVSARRSGRWWTLSVSDTGIGIPPEARRHLFRNAFRADNARGMDESGYGIGLIVCARLVRKLRGRISFSPNPEGGSVFTICLPISYKPGPRVRMLEAAPAPETPEQQDAAESEAVPGKETILIAEDDGQMREYLASVLGAQYNILTADNGRSAYEKAKASNPDIVITDVAMPQMSGDEVCRRLKHSVETSHIPVILLTALSSRESIIHGLESGADDYIVKPFDIAVLRARIKNILGRREQLREVISSPDQEEVEAAEFSNELDRQFISRVREAIEEHISDSEFQVGDLCRELAMSRTAFFAKLKSLTGQGPGDYIRIYRLARAKELLSRHEMSVADVSDAVGFSDSKYFSVCFKKQFGLSPSRV